MAKHEFPRIIQEASNLCGPACVEMMLKYLGIEISTDGFLSLQEKIRSYERMPVGNTADYMAVNETEKDEWKDFATSPVELVNMFQGLAKEVKNPVVGSLGVMDFGKNPLSDLSMNYFSIDAKDSEDNSRKEKVWQFLGHLEGKIKEDTQPPVIIPIHGASHWIVLYDVTVTTKKKGSRHWTFTGKDPEQHPPSKKNDNPNAGIITITDSYSNFDNPVNLVCIENVPNGATINSRQGWKFGTKLALPTRLPGTPIAPTEILNLVRAELSATGNTEIDIIGRRSSMFNFAAPVLVRRPDRPNYDYYLVAVKNNKGEVTQLVRMDALTGEYLDSLQIDPTALYFDITTNDSTTQSMLRSINLQPAGSINARQSVASTQGSVVPNLMWKPSAESQSAFYPFHEVTVGGQPSYVRIDGARFRQINPASTPIPAPQEPSPM